jgi:hypothetical protein
MEKIDFTKLKIEMTFAGADIEKITIVQNDIHESDRVLIYFKDGKVMKVYASSWFDNPILYIK